MGSIKCLNFSLFSKWDGDNTTERGWKRSSLVAIVFRGVLSLDNKSNSAEDEKGEEKGIGV